MKYNFSSMKSKEYIFFKIVKKKQLDNLAKAIGEDSPEGKEKLKESFYDIYGYIARIELAGWCKIDIERLWDEFCLETLIRSLAPKITASKDYVCVMQNSYYQILVSRWTSAFYHKYFSFVEFIIKNLQRSCTKSLRNFFEKKFNACLVPAGNLFKITLATQNSKFFKKITHSLLRHKDTIRSAHMLTKIHGCIISQRPVLKQEDKKNKNKGGKR